ncbi:MAG: ABC transporter substrate-binding protein [Xanthobacteraceae bacterium]|jgi:putative ABC transport system substrate-binding protein
MRRREFIGLVGGAAVTLPLAARAQQTERMRRIGVFMNLAANDPQSSKQISAFLDGLRERGWTSGRNLQIEYRWAADDTRLYHKHAQELIAIAPDVLLVGGGTATGILQQLTSTVPIVFVEASDPVNRGLVASLAQPGGNITGFTQFEFSIGGKWLELLKQIAPSVRRAAVIRDPTQSSAVGQFAAIQALAPSLGVEISPVDAREISAIEQAMTAFARGANGGMIVTATGNARRHRETIISLAARFKLPAVYPYRYYVADGGLASYGPDVAEECRLAAGYVDRILKGEKAADLPVQAATKYATIFNLKTAKAIGLTMPQNLLATADEVIE